MSNKILLDSGTMKQITNHIIDYVGTTATPSEYDKSDTPENEMQKQFSYYMHNWYDVLREVSVPSCDQRDARWEIDESLRIETRNDGSVYITGELKLHTLKMENRAFVDEVIEDIYKMECVTNKYFDTPMGFTLFVTCSEEERDKVVEYAENNNKQYFIPNVYEKNYYAVIVRIVPSANNDHTAPLYAEAWKRRLDEIMAKGNENEYFFPKREKMWNR